MTVENRKPVNPDDYITIPRVLFDELTQDARRMDWAENNLTTGEARMRPRPLRAALDEAIARASISENVTPS